MSLPAAVIGHFIPHQVHADDWSGTVMHGAAGKLSVNARDAGAIEWRLHPLALLLLAMVVDIHWVKVGFVIDGTAEIDSGGFTARDIVGGGPIEEPGRYRLSGRLERRRHADFPRSKGNFHKLSAVGKIEVADISSPGIAAGADLGSYVLELPAARCP